MCNPVDIERDYILYAAQYAIDHGYHHFEIVGPTHHPVKGNCDGMMYYRKYSQFNEDKDAEYVDYCIDVVNQVCDMLEPHGIKVYYWHHELEIPYKFDEEFPEIHNVDGDVEITHPLIKDFLGNKIKDYFHLYPKMAGIVLTLHETRIPLLKLKNQKLGKVERVKYVTEILYNACRALGKELIVRPFASLEEDYSNMMMAYEQISEELVVCDKWTQFDWSLSLPHNAFFKKIKHNPLMVETDIFGEYFGKGFLPIMLKKHIPEKWAYCEGFEPRGYVSRIDRNGFIPFGTPNEVNLDIMNACHDGRDVEEAIDAFFARTYGECGAEVRALMEDTEDIQVMAFHIAGFDMTELSAFPSLNSIKNCYKIEMMKNGYVIDSNEWFIPKNFTRPPLDEVLATKRRAIELSEEKLERLALLKDRLTDEQYDGLYMRFRNLYYVSKLWERLTVALIGYAQFFESGEAKYREMLYSALDDLAATNEAGKAELGIKRYYPTALGARGSLSEAIDVAKIDKVANFVRQAKESFEYEAALTEELKGEGLVDFIIPGSGDESHRLFKEVNFSDTFLFEDGVCRIAGTYRGKAFSTVNAHGWFRYEVKVKPNEENEIVIVAKSLPVEPVEAGQENNVISREPLTSIDFSVEVGGERTVIREKAEGKREFVLRYTEKEGKDKVEIRFDRISAHTPFFYLIKVR